MLFLLQWAKASCANVCRQSIRYGSYISSPLVENLDMSKQPNVKIEQNPAEWEFVEQILPPRLIPDPSVKTKYTSGWKPQTIDTTTVPYLVARNKYHDIPVHLKITFRGTRRQTLIKYIKGDIWALEADLRAFLEDYLKKNMSMRINEFSGQIMILGDYVNLVKHFLLERGH